MPFGQDHGRERERRGIQDQRGKEGEAGHLCIGFRIRGFSDMDDIRARRRRKGDYRTSKVTSLGGENR